MANIVHYKTLDFYPSWDFWFENKPSGNPALTFGLEMTFALMHTF
jgi:hypothetical protein